MITSHENREFWGDLHYISSDDKFQFQRIAFFWKFGWRSCKTAGRSQINKTANLNHNDLTLFG